MAGVRPVVLRPDPVPVARLRRPDPAAAQGLPRSRVDFNEAGQLAQEADVRISGVSVGKVKTIDPDAATGRSDATIELDPQLRAAAARHARDPAPEDAARRDLRRADAGHGASGNAGRRRAAAARARSRRRSSSTRSSARSTRATRDAFRTWMRPARGRRPAAAAPTSTPRSASSRRSRRTRTRCCGSSTPSSRRCAASSPTRARCSTRSASATASCAALIENSQPRVRDDRAARPRARRHVPRPADVRARVDADGQPARALRARRRTRS